MESLEDRTMLSSVNVSSSAGVGDETLEALVDGQSQGFYSQTGVNGKIDGSDMFVVQGGTLSNGYEKLDLFDLDEEGLVNYSEASELCLWSEDDDIVLADGELIWPKEAGITTVNDYDGQQESNIEKPSGSNIVTDGDKYAGE